MNAKLHNQGYIFNAHQLHGAVAALSTAKGKERAPFIQRVLLSALAEIHASGNHSEFTRLALGLAKTERNAVIDWAEDNTWLKAITDEKGKFVRFRKDAKKELYAVEKAAEHDWYAPIIAAKVAKEAAKKADAERGALIASLPTETAPTETAPTETAPTETAPTETAPTETPVDERTPQELDDAELAIDLVRMLSDTQFADFAAFFAQEKERRELAMIAAIRKAA